MTIPRGLPVEPLSEARRARIWRSVSEQLADGAADAPGSPPRKKRETSRWVLLAAAALFSTAFVAYVTVRLVPREHSAVAAAGPTPTSSIVTSDGASEFVLGDNALIVGPNSELVASGDDARGVLLVLTRGEVTCEVAPREGRPPFVVQAGPMQVRVLGTHFHVTRSGDVAQVDVQKGVVEVSARGTTALVHPGESWSLPPGRRTH
jgi:transmembrane sensor